MSHHTHGAAGRTLSAAASVLAVSIVFAAGVARAETVNLGSISSVTQPPNASNSSGGFTLSSTPVFSHIRVSGTLQALNGGSFANEGILMLVGPGGQRYDISISGGEDVPAAPYSTSSMPAVQGSPSGNGAWTWEFYESYDDNGPASADSQWTGVTVEFLETGYPLPYSQAFTPAPPLNLGFGLPFFPPAVNNGYVHAATLVCGYADAQGFSLATGTIGNPTTFTNGPRSIGAIGLWRETGFLNSGSTGAVSTFLDNGPANDWLISPTFDLGDGSIPYTLGYKIGTTSNFGTGGGGTPLNSDERFLVLVSDEGGNVWREAPAQVLKSYGSGYGSGIAGTVETVSLAGFTGKRRIAFYGEGVSSSSPNGVRVHIDDISIAAAGPVLNLADASVTEGNSGTATLLIPYTAAGFTAPFTVDVGVTDGSATQAGSDYVAPSATATITAASGTIAVTVNGDTTPENNETFTLTISNPSATAVIADGSAVGTILDDDYDCLSQGFATASGTTPPAGWSQQTLAGTSADVWRFDNPGGRSALAPLSAPFAIVDSDTFSENGTAEDVVLVSPPYNCTGSTAVKVEWDEVFVHDLSRQTLEVSTDGSSWTPAMDNSATSYGTFTGISVRRIVDISGLAANQPSVQVRFRWRSDGGYFWLIDNFQFCGDQPTPELRTVSPFAAAAEEGQGTGSLQMPVRLSSSSGTTTEVSYTVAGGPGANAATAGTDFTGTLSGTVTFMPGDTEEFIPITPVGDMDREANENLTVTLTGIVSGDAVIASASAPGTIINDDPLPPGLLFGINTSGALGALELDPLNPATSTVLDTYHGIGTYLIGGDFAGNDFSTFYATEFFAYNLYRFDAVTREQLSVTPITGMPVDRYPTALGWDHATNQMYYVAINVTNLTEFTFGTLNLATGVATPIGQLSPGPSLVNGLAFGNDPAGTMYVVDHNAGDRLMTVNKTTGATTVVGPLGVDAGNILADADMEDAMGVIYATAKLGANYSLLSINPTTGAATVVFNLETDDFEQFSAFGATSPLAGSGVPDWTTLD